MLIRAAACTISDLDGMNRLSVPGAESILISNDNNQTWTIRIFEHKKRHTRPLFSRDSVGDMIQSFIFHRLLVANIESTE